MENNFQEQEQNKERPIIESQQSFYFGLAVGIAGMAILGLLVLGNGFIKNNGNDDGSVANIKPTAAKNTDTQPQAGIKDVKVDKNDHIRGNKNAKITIVEFSDIQCPYCSRFHETMKQVMQNYPNDVRWVFKHFPLDSLHPYARKAAEASECAAEQNKFWEYTDKLYENQANLSPEYIKSAAQELGLNTGKFNDCVDSSKYKAKVDADAAAGRTLGVQGTPGSFLNGQSIPGAVPYSSIEAMIKAAQ